MRRHDAGMSPWLQSISYGVTGICTRRCRGAWIGRANGARLRRGAVLLGGPRETRGDAQAHHFVWRGGASIDVSRLMRPAFGPPIVATSLTSSHPPHRSSSTPAAVWNVGPLPLTCHSQAPVCTVHPTEIVLQRPVQQSHVSTTSPQPLLNTLFPSLTTTTTLRLHALISHHQALTAFA